MIGSLRGTLQAKDADTIIVETGGVGYVVHIPLTTFYTLPDVGAEVKLRIHTHVRDDALQLFGFRDTGEQRLFEHLIGVAGIGPKLAVTILSGMDVATLIQSIAEENVARLTTIPGVGKKTAERMALELKDRVEDLVSEAAVPSGPGGMRKDVVSALVNLGYRRRDAERALDRVEDPADGFEELLKQTLRMLAA